MLIGVPREIKDNEFRIGLTPASVAELVDHGHLALVERSAGVGSELPDGKYVAEGTTLVDSPFEIFRRAEMVVKVKEPLAHERKQLRRGQMLFSYLHLALDLAQTKEPHGKAVRPALPMKP
jgi:alanine dehydrogenase